MNGIQKILEMKEKRANLTSNIRSIMDEFEGKEMGAEKKNELRALETDFDKINASIMAEERQIERERLNGEKFPIKNELKGDKKEEIRAAFDQYLRNGADSDYANYRALAQDNPTQAGYLVAPQKFVSELIGDLNNILFFRQIANVLPTLTGAQSLGYPKRTARMNTASWGTELTSPTADSAYAFGKREFKPYVATGEILVSKTLMRNAPNTEMLVRDELTYNFGTLLETAYMTGNGVGKPLGVFTANADGISTARDVSTGNTTTAMTFDGLIEAKYSIKEQYQANLNWIFHRDGVKQIQKIKDNNGQYIWQQAVANNRPDTLLGIPVRMSEYAPNTFTTGLYVGILGDFKQYWIADSLELQIQVLNELYARTNQVDIIARIETDGMPVVEEAFARVKLA